MKHITRTSASPGASPIASPGVRSRTFLPALFVLLLAATGLVPATGAAATTRGIPAPPPCDGASVQLRAGSTLDLGWTGSAHGMGLPQGPVFGVAVLRRCSDDQAPCLRDADCTGGQCLATCDCGQDSTCEVTGPVTRLRCLTNMAECTSEADCPNGVPCVALSGPPIPLSRQGVPTCSVASFDSPLAGSADFAGGEMTLSATLRWRVFLGIAVSQPCPRCGRPEQDPEVGEVFTCDGGQFPGATCTVDGVSAEFGGVSYDCPPSLASGITGAGLVMHLDQLTTATTTRTAELPCSNFAFRQNPLNAPANPGKCLDDQSACTSNADCRRCSGDPATPCDADDDCTGKGACAEAPDQPISCGFWCGCGFCGDDPSLPCFDDSQCPSGLACGQGTGSPSQQNAPQAKPNDCSSDGFVCGLAASKQCAGTTTGTCSEQPFRTCTTDGNECLQAAAGTCVVEPLACFGPRITRQGQPSPIGSYCANAADACQTNADCPLQGDFCVDDASAADLAAVFCAPGTSSSAVNATNGTTGPAALHWRTLVQVCRCAEENPACEGFCADLNPCQSADDGTPCSDLDPCTVGDACDEGICVPGSGQAPECSTTTTIVVEPLCGDANGDGMITSSDALEVLKVAVGLQGCEPSVCDYDGDGRFSTSDALAVLRASVALPTTPACP